MFPDLEYIKTLVNGIKTRFEKIEKKIADAIVPPSTASIGQTIVVKAVDKNGKPMAWETVDGRSDWLQKDAANISYIQNRPFFDDRKYGKTVEATIAMNSSKTLESIDSEAWNLLVSDNHPIIVCNKAVFQYYEKSDSTIIFRLVTSEIDSTVCFFIYVSTESPKACWYNINMPNGVSGSSTIQIKEILSGDFKKIDRNFLPDIILTDSSGNNWNVYVNSDGSIKTRIIY